MEVVLDPIQDKPIGIEAWILSDLSDLTFEEALEELGGPGSGHHGHKGISGSQGGSAPSLHVAGGVGNTSRNEYEAWEGRRSSVACTAYDSVKSVVMPKREGGFVLHSKEKEALGITYYRKQEHAYIVMSLATKRKGLGRAMMGEVCRRAAKVKAGVKLVAVPGASGFYRRIGMREGSESMFSFSLKEAAEFAKAHRP